MSAARHRFRVSVCRDAEKGVSRRNNGGVKPTFVVYNDRPVTLSGPAEVWAWYDEIARGDEPANLNRIQ